MTKPISAWRKKKLADVPIPISQFIEPPAVNLAGRLRIPLEIVEDYPRLQQTLKNEVGSIWRLLRSGTMLTVDESIILRTHWRNIILAIHEEVNADVIFRTKETTDKCAEIISEVKRVIKVLIGRYNFQHQDKPADAIACQPLYTGIMAEVGVYIALQSIFPQPSLVRFGNIEEDKANTDIVVEVTPQLILLLQVKSTTGVPHDAELTTHQPSNESSKMHWITRYRIASNLTRTPCIVSNINYNRIEGSETGIDLATGYPSESFMNRLELLLRNEHEILNRIGQPA